MYSNDKPADNSSLSRKGSFDYAPGSFKSLKEASGPIPYGMTNDYMFRAVLQSNGKVLRGLICSLLHLPESEIFSLEITNPVILGRSVKNKEYRLDIHILLNGRARLNLEMQVTNRLNWPNRSVLYLCRSFDTPMHGQDYSDAIPAIHIGFLDYTLFKDCPEFYATYKLINVKNHHVYSDNLTLCVVDLSKIESATEEDKSYGIDRWARLFKAATWEELKMLAAQNEYLREASETIFRLNTDERIRKQCQDREEYYQDLHNYEREIERMKAHLEETIAEKDTVISEKDAAISEKDTVISEKDAAISEKNNAISERDAVISEKDAVIQKLLAKIDKLENQKPL